MGEIFYRCFLEVKKLLRRVWVLNTCILEINL